MECLILDRSCLVKQGGRYWQLQLRLRCCIVNCFAYPRKAEGMRHHINVTIHMSRMKHPTKVVTRHKCHDQRHLHAHHQRARMMKKAFPHVALQNHELDAARSHYS